MASSLRDKLQSGAFVMTAEVTPPLSSNPADLLEKALPLKGFADAVNVTDGASARAHLDSMIAATILLNNGIEPILQLTCRDRNRIALQSELVARRHGHHQHPRPPAGDDPKKGDQPDAKPVFDLDLRRPDGPRRPHSRQGRAAAHGRKVGRIAGLFHRRRRRAGRSARRTGRPKSLP